MAKSDSSSSGSSSESSSDSDDSAEEERNNQLKILEQEVSFYNFLSLFFFSIFP